MPRFTVTEYNRLATERNGFGMPVVQEPSLKSKSYDFASSTQSEPFLDGTRFALVTTDTDCRLAFGPNPTATADGRLLAAGVEVWVGVEPGDRVAAITA